MHTHADQSQETKTEAPTARPSSAQVEDRRPQTQVLRQLQASIDNSPRVKRAAQLQAAANGEVAQLKWVDNGEIRLKWVPKIPGFEWYFDQGMNKFVYTLDRPGDMPEKLVLLQRIPLSEDQLDTLGFEELAGTAADAQITAVFSEENQSVEGRAKANKDYHEARAKGLELWMNLQNTLFRGARTKGLDAYDTQFDQHYFSDLDSSKFEGEFKGKELTDDQYTAWSWGYEDPSKKPNPQGEREPKEAFDKRMGAQGEAQYENFFDLGEDGKISVESVWRDRDMASGAKAKSVPTNILLWNQYEKAAADREARGQGSKQETYENLNVITQNNLANDETINVIKVAYGPNGVWNKAAAEFVPGSEQFFALIGSANCKGIVRMLAERVDSLHKTIESVVVRPEPEIESASIDMKLKTIKPKAGSGD